MFEEGKVYIISKGRIKVANKRYTHITNDYTIDLNMDSEVIFAGEDKAIQNMKYDFKNLATLAELDDKAYIDCCGIVDHIGDIQSFTSKRTQKDLTKRNFRICDQSGSSVECTLWGDEAQNFDMNSLHQVICCKAARVSEFNGKSLSVNKYNLNPEGIPEVGALKQWWQSEGSSAQFTCLTQSRGFGGGKNDPPITMHEMEQRGLGMNPDTPDYFNLRVTIESVMQDKENGKLPWYKAIPETEGDVPAYKVTPADDGQGWFCEKTGKTYNSYRARYVLRFRAADCTGSQFFNAYDEAGKVIMGMEASEIEKFVDGNDDQGYLKCFDDATLKLWNVRVKARQDTYNDEARRRLDVVGCTPIDLAEDCKQMLNEIQV